MNVYAMVCVHVEHWEYFLDNEIGVNIGMYTAPI